MTVFWQDVERLAIYVMMVRQVCATKICDSNGMEPQAATLAWVALGRRREKSNSDAPMMIGIHAENCGST